MWEWHSVSHHGQFRILVPASAPPSTDPGVWRRKSSVGQVDAQGNLLIHPMVSKQTSLPGDWLIDHAR